MRICKGKVLVSINDHPDIRAAFDGFHFEETSIKYSVANTHGTPVSSLEPVIMNWEPSAGSLFLTSLETGSVRA
jgi:DNA adenine methylase